MPDPATLASRSRVGSLLDALLVVLVVAFAFLAASFTARNSDLWLHLAAGRLLHSGEYQFGIDPFASTTTGLYWANHAWLLDWFMYITYDRFGGGVLVVLKAIGVALLGAVMHRTGRLQRGPVWLICGCVLLALIAMSPRLVLQPACASLVLLALLLWLLQVGGRAYAAVPILVAFWVNVDGWFILAPLIVVIARLGNRARPPAERVPTWLLTATMAACLCSPHHIRAITLPPELSPAVWASELPEDPRLAGFFASPWRIATFGPGGNYSLSAWAFPVLLLISGASFAMNRRSLSHWTSWVWLVFAGLAAWQARLVPFFAVIAGPIAANNLADLRLVRRFDRFGRLTVAMVTCTALLLTWPGWLQGFHARDRAAAWAVEADPSLERVARDLGQQPRGRVFTTHPDAAHYLVWFAPGERGFLDSRLQLFTQVAADYAEMSRDLGLLQEEDHAFSMVKFRKRNIDTVLLWESEPGRLASALRETTPFPERWPILRVDGNAVLLGVGGKPEFKPERLAFGSPIPGELPAAPIDAPGGLPSGGEWWNLAAGRMRGRTWEADAASTYLRIFEFSPLPESGTGLSPALPLLAVRAGRIAVASHPEAAENWLTLARSYLVLGRGTWEAGTEFAPRGFLRHSQTAAALYQAVILNPDSLAAHEAIAGLYAERQFLDLALVHLREQLRLVRRNGRQPGEPRDSYSQRVERIADAVNKVEQLVQDGENRYLVRTHGRAGDPLARARTARDLGLTGKAIDVLLKSHPDLYGTDGLRLLLDLLIGTGQAEAAGALLERSELGRRADSLGFYELPGGVREGRRWGYRFHARDWLIFAQAASAGRYDRATEALTRLRNEFQIEEDRITPQLNAAIARQFASETGLALPPAGVITRLHVARERDRLAEYIGQLRLVAAERADLHTLAGMLHLERGDPVTAAMEFTRALEIYSQVKDGAPAVSGQPVAARYLEAIRQQR